MNMMKVQVLIVLMLLASLPALAHSAQTQKVGTGLC